MILIGKAGHAVVGLRPEFGAGEPSLGVNAQNRQPAGPCEILNERDDEHGLAGPRQAGDAKPEAGSAQIIGDAAGGHVGFESEIGKAAQGKIPAGGNGPI